jgi:ABC-type Mn2+/Zn2+ transport system permease subunit
VLIGPAAAARQLTDRIVPMLALAAAIAVLGGIAGLHLSYYAGTAGGASVALGLVATYLLSLLATRPRSLLGQKRARPEATIA